MVQGSLQFRGKCEEEDQALWSIQEAEVQQTRGKVLLLLLLLQFAAHTHTLVPRFSVKLRIAYEFEQHSPCIVDSRESFGAVVQIAQCIDLVCMTKGESRTALHRRILRIEILSSQQKSPYFNYHPEVQGGHRSCLLGRYRYTQPCC